MNKCLLRVFFCNCLTSLLFPLSFAPCIAFPPGTSHSYLHKKTPKCQLCSNIYCPFYHHCKVCFCSASARIFQLNDFHRPSQNTYTHFFVCFSKMHIMLLWIMTCSYEIEGHVLKHLHRRTKVHLYALFSCCVLA